MTYAVCQWGVLVLLAKLGNPEMVGQFGFRLAVSAPVMLFAGLQLRAVQATDARREYALSNYLALSIVTSILGLLVVTGIVLTGGYRWDTALIVLVIASGKAWGTVGEVFYGLFQQHERLDRVGKATILQGVASLAGLASGLILTGSVLYGAVGWAIAPGLGPGDLYGGKRSTTAVAFR